MKRASRSTWLTVALVASTAACAPPPPRPSRAPVEPQPVTVTTRDGVITGQVRDTPPGDALVVVTKEGERRVAWKDITSLTLDVVPRADPIEPSQDRFSNPDDRPREGRESDDRARRRTKQAWHDVAPDTRLVRVVLTGDRETLTQTRRAPLVGDDGGSVRTDYDALHTHLLCTGPCEVTIRVHPTDTFRVGSYEIILPPGKPEAHIDLQHRGLVVPPAALLVLGAVALPTGSALLGYGLRNDRDRYTTAGAISVAAGAGLLTVGAVWMALAKPRSIRVSRAPLGVVRF
jgi:hypothetical protein